MCYFFFCIPTDLLISLCHIQERLTVGRTPGTKANMVPEGEVILTINIYYPTAFDKVSIHPCFRQSASSLQYYVDFHSWMLPLFLDMSLSNFAQFNYIRPHMTLLMTGTHNLAELRDAICCVSDLQVCGEFSKTPDMAPEFISKVTTRRLYL